jgi:hypothetical protein
LTSQLTDPSAPEAQNTIHHIKQKQQLKKYDQKIEKPSSGTFINLNQKEQQICPKK